MLGIIQKSSRSISTVFRSFSTDKFNGVFPPIITPFDSKENISLDKLKKNLAVWDSKPFKGYTVLGSNGEFQLLSMNEKCNLVKCVKDFNPDKLVIAGSGQESTKLTIEGIDRLSDCGADVALVYNPCFYRGSMKHEAYMSHYLAIADASPIPILLYNVPANTAMDIPLNTILELAEHENIVGLKESSGNAVRIGEVVHRTAHLEFNVLAGSAGFMLSTYSVGAVGVIAALANVMGGEVCELHNAIKANSATALDLQYRLIAPNTAVTATYGIAGLKFVADKIGLDGTLPRRPIQPLPETDQHKLLQIMRKAGLSC